MRKSLTRVLVAALLVMVFALPGMAQAETAKQSAPSPAIAESPVEPVRELVVLAGTSRVLTFAYVQRVAVANPSVADVVVASQQEVLVNGMTSGVTTLHIWLRDERVTYSVRVVSDLTSAISELKTLLADPAVTISAQREAIILSGTVNSPARKERATKLAQVFSSNVIDLLVVEASDAAQVIKQAIGDPNVSVNLHGETVILEGRVAGENAKKRAEDIARAFAGKVVNLVEVDTTAQMSIDLAGIVTKMIGDPKVQARMVGESLFLEGEVSSETARQRADQIARALTTNVVNLVQVTQVQVIRGTSISSTTTTVSTQEQITSKPGN